MVNQNKGIILNQFSLSGLLIKVINNDVSVDFATNLLTALQNEFDDLMIPPRKIDYLARKGKYRFFFLGAEFYTFVFLSNTLT